jgi:hypothetical protein
LIANLAGSPAQNRRIVTMLARKITVPSHGKLSERGSSLVAIFVTPNPITGDLPYVFVHD